MNTQIKGSFGNVPNNKIIRKINTIFFITKLLLIDVMNLAKPKT